MTAANVTQEIRQLIWELVGVSLCVRQHEPALRVAAGGVEVVAISGDVSLSNGMGRGERYADSWQRMAEGDAFHLKMIDGALVQMLYTFIGGTLVKHRLAFFPRPRQHSFDNEPEFYELDELFADIVGEGLVHVPVRFDFTRDDPANCAIDHPVSHLSLGQYPNCRIPVSAPLSPRTFMGFVLRSFYFRAYREAAAAIQLETHSFPRTLVPEEAATHHVSVPHLAA